MKAISNKSIMGLLAIALLISITGTIINVYRLGIFQGSGLLTGAATDTGTGTSTITISSSTSLDNQVASIAFGSGFVNGSCSSCVMDSDGKQNQTGRCCRDFNNVSSGFLLENTGNINMSVNYTCSGSCSSDTFIGGNSPRFEIRVSANSIELQNGEAGRNDTATSCNNTQGGGGWNYTQGRGNVSYGNNTNHVRFSERTYVLVNTTAWLCGNGTNYPLEFNDFYDAAIVDINVSVPSDAPGGGAAQTATFTFTGLSTG